MRTVAICLINVTLCLLFPWRAVRHWKMKRQDMHHLTPRRILVVRTDHIGDAYLSLPALAWLRQRFPQAHLTVLAASWSAPLFIVANLYDELIICDPPWWARRRKARFGGDSDGSWQSLLRVIRKLRSQRFDLCVELRGELSQIIAFGVLSGSRHLLTRSRHGGEVLADKAPVIDENLHECEQNLQLVQLLGGNVSPEPPYPQPYESEDIKFVEKLLPEVRTGPCILIHPGAKWVNRWPESAYIVLLQKLAERQDLTVLLTGSASESALCERLAACLPGRAFNLAGTLTLTQQAALMSKVDLVLMADTGPMHFLNALTTPAVLLFGPTPSERFAPQRDGLQVIQGGQCCSMHLHEHCTQVQPGMPSACMVHITPEQIYAAIDKLVGNAHPTKRVHQSSMALLG